MVMFIFLGSSVLMMSLLLMLATLLVDEFALFLFKGLNYTTFGLSVVLSVLLIVLYVLVSIECKKTSKN